jgi:hypothetical protein
LRNFTPRYAFPIGEGKHFSLLRNVIHVAGMCCSHFVHLLFVVR